MTDSAPASIARPPARSWLPIVGALLLALVVALGLWGGFGIVVYRLRHSPAGRAAVAELRASPQLQALLGQPLRVRIEGGDLAQGGRASFTVVVRGPHGVAHAEVQSALAVRAWRITGGTLTLGNGQPVPLSASPPTVTNPAVP